MKSKEFGKIVVIVTAAKNDDMAELCLPPTSLMARGGGRLYRFYRDANRNDAAAISFVDPVDGEPLIRMFVFDSMDDAYTWVREDHAGCQTRTIQ